MPPGETQEQLRERLESPGTLERGATLFDVETFSGTFVGAVVQAEARGSGRFQESGAHSWEGCANLPLECSVSKDGCIFLCNAVKDSACGKWQPRFMLALCDRS